MFDRFKCDSVNFEFIVRYCLDFFYSQFQRGNNKQKNEFVFMLLGAEMTRSTIYYCVKLNNFHCLKQIDVFMLSLLGYLKKRSEILCHEREKSTAKEKVVVCSTPDDANGIAAGEDGDKAAMEEGRIHMVVFMFMPNDDQKLNVSICKLYSCITVAMAVIDANGGVSSR